MEEGTKENGDKGDGRREMGKEKGERGVPLSPFHVSHFTSHVSLSLPFGYFSPSIRLLSSTHSVNYNHSSTIDSLLLNRQ
jgi:hypothetical protein